MATKKLTKPAVDDKDPTNFAELLAEFKKFKKETASLIPERVEPTDRSFIDQFHARLSALERNNGQPVYPFPDDDAEVTRMTPSVETFDLKPDPENPVTPTEAVA